MVAGWIYVCVIMKQKNTRKSFTRVSEARLVVRYC